MKIVAKNFMYHVGTNLVYILIWKVQVLLLKNEENFVFSVVSNLGKLAVLASSGASGRKIF